MPQIPRYLSPAPRVNRAAPVLRELAADLLALVWPVECAGCGLPNRACCDACLDGLLRVALAAADAQSDAATRLPHDAALGPPRFCAGIHAGLLRDLLVPFKHAGRTSLAPILGAVLAVPLANAMRLARGPDPPLIVPIPSRPERVRERGFRHVEVLGAAALRVLRRANHRAPVMLCALRTLPGRTSQVGLRVDGRRRNAARIAVRSPMRRRVVGREVILLDDVRTTGETLEAAAIVLARTGAQVVAVVTLVHAQRHAPKK